MKKIIVGVLAFGLGFVASYYYKEQQTQILIAEAIQKTKDETPACEPEKIPPTKDECLPILTASDLKGWQEAQLSKVEQFLVTNDKIWHPAKDVSRATEVDTSLLKGAAGTYSLSLKFSDLPNMTASGTFEFKNLKSLTGINDLKINYLKKSRQQDEVFRYSMQNLTGEDFGTNKDEKAIHVIWMNTVKEEWPQFSHFAVSLPSEMKVKQKATVDLYALSDELQWQVVGEAILNRTR